MVAAVTRALPYILVTGAFFFIWNWSWPAASPLAVPSFILAYLLHFFYQIIFGTLVFWLMEIHGILYAREFLVLALSGSFIPLWFFPDWLFSITAFLPFRYIYHSPLSMLVGRLTGGAALRELILQAIWLAILIILSNFIWKRGLKRVIVNGG